MDILKSWTLNETFKIAQVASFPREEIVQQSKKYLANDFPMLSSLAGVSPEDHLKLKELKNNVKQQFILRLAILKNEKLIGWTDGWQDSVETDSFFMGASLILPEFRRQGLYSALVKKVVEITKENGFQSIWSLHVMTNNSVLIAKMKLGFNIYGFEVNTRYGALVRLIYHHNQVKQKILNLRAGALGDEEALKILTRTV